jgi:hypothetical protein
MRGLRLAKIGFYLYLAQAATGAAVGFAIGLVYAIAHD